jgi:glucose/arabinose dehydrogenase
MLAAGQGVVCAQPAIQLDPIATGLNNPVAVTHAGDGSGRLFITLRPGSILIHDGQQLLPTPFLDIGTLIASGGERGLLSTAFHPGYASNGHFYVNYTDLAGDTVVARYSVSVDANVADPGSAEIVFTAAQPFSNHNGGQLQFGPDGYLYIGMGDGGSGGDPQNHAQTLSSVLGKLLRIDVDTGSPYAIPADNPFRNEPGAALEIWALGLRNPWRFSFDRLTGDLFLTDVGQAEREEINVQAVSSPGGENYGWRLMEGSLCFNPAAGCNDGTLTLPVLEYDHTEGCSVSGGYRYRGAINGELEGIYFYGDFCTGRLWGASQDQQGTWSTVELLDTELQITSFGEDQAGELYVASFQPSPGALYRIVEIPTVPPPAGGGGGGGCFISNAHE